MISREVEFYGDLVMVEQQMLFAKHGYKVSATTDHETGIRTYRLHRYEAGLRNPIIFETPILAELNRMLKLVIPPSE